MTIFHVHACVLFNRKWIKNSTHHPPWWDALPFATPTVSGTLLFSETVRFTVVIGQLLPFQSRIARARTIVKQDGNGVRYVFCMVSTRVNVEVDFPKR